MIIDNDWVIAETPADADQLQFGTIRKEDEYITAMDWNQGRRSWLCWGCDYGTTEHSQHMRSVNGGYRVRRPRRMFPHLNTAPESIHFI